MIKNYKFKGHDWFELLEVFEISPAPFDDDNPLRDDEINMINLKGFFAENMRKIESCTASEDAKKEVSEVTDKIKEFLEELSKNAKRTTYLAPLYDGIRMIEDDWTFLSVCIDNADRFWD